LRDDYFGPLCKTDRQEYCFRNKLNTIILYTNKVISVTKDSLCVRTGVSLYLLVFDSLLRGFESRYAHVQRPLYRLPRRSFPPMRLQS